MLTIRRAQMEVFERALRAPFANAMRAHLRHFFTREFAAQGDAAVDDFIHAGIARAELHDIDTDTEVCRYIDLMVVLGPWFDCDDVFPWAQAILCDGGARSADARLGALEDAVEKWSSHVE